VRLGPRPFATTKIAVVSVYDTVPEREMAPCCTVNVVVVIVLGSIGVLKVAVIILTAATLAEPVAPFVLLSGSFIPPFAGDVRITVGVVQTLTIPGTSFLQPAIKTMKSNATVNPAESGMPRNPRIV
jgi:hypothetical protein